MCWRDLTSCISDYWCPGATKWAASRPQGQGLQQHGTILQALHAHLTATKLCTGRQVSILQACDLLFPVHGHVLLFLHASRSDGSDSRMLACC